MIGDHKQLPPFDIDKVSKLLASTDRVNPSSRIGGFERIRLVINQ